MRALMLAASFATLATALPPPTLPLDFYTGEQESIVSWSRNYERTDETGKKLSWS